MGRYIIVKKYETPEDCIALAVAYSKSGDLVSAQKSARRATELDPLSEDAWRSVAISSSKLGAQEDELAALQNLSSISGKSGDWQQLSVVNGKLGQYQEAETAARKALEIEPGNFQALKSLIRSVVEQGRFDDAEALCVDKSDLKILVNRKIDSLKHDSASEVVTYLKKIVNKYPDDPDFRQILGAHLRKYAVKLRNEGNVPQEVDKILEAALAAHNAALELAPANINNKFLASVWYAKGRANLELDNLTDACNCFSEALRLNPNHPQAKIYHLGQCQGFKI